MGIKYSIKAIKNPGCPNKPALFYPQLQVRESVDLYRIAREIGQSTSLTEGDVLNVVQSLGMKVQEHLANGDNVKLGEFFTIQYQLRGKGAASIDDFDPRKNIKGLKFQFRPGALLKRSIHTMDLEYVVPVRVRRQIVREEKQKLRNSNI